MTHPDQPGLDLDVTPVTGKKGRVPAQRDRRASSGRVAVNDMALIEDVIALALDPGYLLIGPSEQVWRWQPGAAQEIDRVPDYEDAAVHQLLHTGLLTRGHTVSARYRDYEGRAIRVSVPTTTRNTALRWRSYRPGPQVGRPTTRQSPIPRAEHR